VGRALGVPGKEVDSGLSVATAMGDYVPATVAHFVPAKVGVTMSYGVFSALRNMPVVAAVYVVAVVYVTMEAAWSMKPWPCADEDPAAKPLRPIVAIRCAGIGRVIIISVGAYRRRADLHRDLSLRTGRRNNKQHAECCHQTNVFE
jgi:hypothetical protein